MTPEAHLQWLTQDAILPKLSDALEHLQAIERDSSDLLINPVTVGGVSCALLCCEGMLSTSTITNLILVPLTAVTETFSAGTALLEHLHTHLLLSIDRVQVRNSADLFRTLNSGFAVLLADGANYALAFGVQGYDKRGLDEPSGELNLYGAKEGFSDVVRTNMSLIRRRMKSPLLTLHLMVCGSISRTDLCICYLRDRVPDALVAKIQSQLEGLPLETILASGYLRPFLEQESRRIFHAVGITERPDVLCAKLLEGRVAVLIDGTPFALVIPQLFCEPFQTLDDYNSKPSYATFIRWLKYGAFLLSLLLPALYLAIAVWHPDLLHETLLLLLAESERSAPFSLFSETLGVLLMYEIIREAGLRLPKAVGGAVSIVGGLIIGDAAVNSGLISTPLLTVAALSVTAGFVIPELHQPMTLLRIGFVVAAAVAGLSGIALLGMAVLWNLCATESYDFPVTAPAAPFSLRAMRDVWARVGFRTLARGNFTVEEVRQHHANGDYS